MSDIADNAQSAIEQHIESGLSKIQRYEGVSATHCRDCGTGIPEARRQAVLGCIRCVDCASIKVQI